MKQKFEISGEIVEQPSVDPGPALGSMKFLRIVIRGPRRANQAEGHDQVARMIPINHIIDHSSLPVTDIEGFIAREAGNAFASWIRDRMQFERENGIRLNALSGMINRRNVQRESRISALGAERSSQNNASRFYRPAGWAEARPNDLNQTMDYLSSVERERLAGINQPVHLPAPTNQGTPTDAPF